MVARRELTIAEALTATAGRAGQEPTRYAKRPPTAAVLFTVSRRTSYE